MQKHVSSDIWESPGPKPTKTILEEAQEACHKSRQKDYGSPLDNHGRTASLVQAYMEGKGLLASDAVLTPEDICFFNILQKVARGINDATRDTLVDIAGYAHNVEMVQNDRDARNQPCEVEDDEVSDTIKDRLVAMGRGEDDQC